MPLLPSEAPLLRCAGCHGQLRGCEGDHFEGVGGGVGTMFFKTLWVNVVLFSPNAKPNSVFLSWLMTASWDSTPRCGFASSARVHITVHAASWLMACQDEVIGRFLPL